MIRLLHLAINSMGAKKKINTYCMLTKYSGLKSILPKLMFTWNLPKFLEFSMFKLQLAPEANFMKISMAHV